MWVEKWADCLAIRLPTQLVETLGIKEGDEYEVRIVSDQAFEVSLPSEAARARALQRIRAQRRDLPLDWKPSRDDANSR